MGKSIGIDLGTTNSVAALKKIKTEIIKNSEGDFITPSAVSVTKKRMFNRNSGFVVGKDALEWRKQNPQNTITGIKRLMGRNFDDKDIQELLKNSVYEYKISEYSKGSKNSIAVTLDGHEYTPQEISAEILKKIKADVEQNIGDDVDTAVITVPAYFNDKQKHATRMAASLAGLRVQRLLPEPTAAAIAFGVDEIGGDKAENIIIFDFGGGTFDLSLLSISGGQFIEQGKGGDMWLGGDDIDNLLTKHVLKVFADEHGINDIEELIAGQPLKQRNLFIGELQAEVENAKITLTEEDEAYVEISGILKGADGTIYDLDVEVTRKEFDKLIAPIVQKSVQLTVQLIESIDFTPDLIDRILLVGGSSKIPAIAEALKIEFGNDKIVVHERPMLAVAEGAAILSHRLADSYECPTCGKEVEQSAKQCVACGCELEEYRVEHGVFDIVHTTAHDYYIQLEDGKTHLMIEKNTPLPAEAFEIFSLVSIDQKLIHLQFINRVNDVNEAIGELWLSLNFDLENVLNEAELQQIFDNDKKLHVKVKMSIDENNLIAINAEMVELPQVALSKTLSRGNADEKLFYEVEKLIEEVNSEAHDPDVVNELPLRLAGIASRINNIVDDDNGLADQTLIDNSQMQIEKVQLMLEHEIEAIEGNVRYLKNMLQRYGKYMPKELRRNSALKIAEVQQAKEHASYEEELDIMEEFVAYLDHEQLEYFTPLMMLDRNIMLASHASNPQIVKILTSLHDGLLKAYRKHDMEKYHRLLDENEDILNRVAAINYKVNNESSCEKIHKGITV